ncbi:hypothetical protein SteCoe_17380 [Stentor coeruleus]|uniref:Uncharacterized protein n=1 Tax=Stentor coeruleus TaxID=5963 RepID=A0A1R2BZ64_9CILI|nr:hypothetical protein SteCoe_17380 [Stentor coeruleus]
MESPIFTLNRPKNISPPRPKTTAEQNSSDSFSNSRGMKSNNSPDYPKQKPSTKFAGKNEFTSSVQEFLKQSTEIQDEIRKLSEICQQISPKFVGGKEIEVPEKIDWEKVNEILGNCGFKSLVIKGDEVEYESLAETFMEVVYEYSSQAGILEQNKSAMQKLESEIDQLSERNKYLESKSDKTKSRPNFEKEIQELEKMSKNMETKFRRMKERLKEKDEIIKSLHLRKSTQEKQPVPSSEFSTDFSHLKEIFESFMYREFRDKSKTDRKILNLIESYEKKQSDTNLQVILDELEVFSGDEALQTIAKLKQESFAYIEIEKIIHEIYYGLFSKTLNVRFSVKYEEVLDEILQKINEMKDDFEGLEEFKIEVVNALMCKKNCSPSEVNEQLKGLVHFRKLFQISSKDNEIKVIENLFLFVHEIKMFLQHARTIMGREKLSLSELLEELTHVLVRNYE